MFLDFLCCAILFCAIGVVTQGGRDAWTDFGVHVCDTFSGVRVFVRRSSFELLGEPEGLISVHTVLLIVKFCQSGSCFESE